MAGDVAKQVNTGRVGVEGAAYIAPNGLQIVPTTRQKVTTTNLCAPLSDVALSGEYVNRFNDRGYY